jgi:hypothetical protein
MTRTRWEILASFLFSGIACELILTGLHHDWQALPFVIIFDGLPAIIFILCYTTPWKKEVMASAETRAELIACIRAAESIVNEALPPGAALGDSSDIDRAAIRGAAMNQTVRELFDNEVEGV